jgi:very-short-patch-repair endonuclease
MLWVEIDGSSHDDKQYYDKVRSKLLRDFGIKIIRYTNTQIMKELEWVFDDLIWQIKQREKEIMKVSI